MSKFLFGGHKYLSAERVAANQALRPEYGKPRIVTLVKGAEDYSLATWQIAVELDIRLQHTDALLEDLQRQCDALRDERTVLFDRRVRELEALEQPLAVGQVISSRNDDHCVVYALAEEQGPERVRYVGKSSAPLRRFVQYLQGVNPGTRVTAWAQETRAAGRHIVLTILAVYPNDDAMDAGESVWMRLYRDRGMADLNGATPQQPGSKGRPRQRAWERP